MRIALEEGTDKILLLKPEGDRFVVTDCLVVNHLEPGGLKCLTERNNLPIPEFSDWRLLAGADHISSISWTFSEIEEEDEAAFTPVGMLVWIKMIWNECLNTYVPEEVYSSLEAATDGLEGEWRKIATFEFNGFINDSIGRDIIIIVTHLNTSVGRIR